MTGRLVLGLMIVTGCGRFEFDRSAPLDASTPDVGDLPSLAPIHRYRLAGDFADDLAGPTLEGEGGTLAGGNGYQYKPNQGLRLLNAMPVATYTIDLRFSFDTLGGYRKLIDFKDLATDEGLYVFDEVLRFVIVASTETFVSSPLPLFSAGTTAEVTVTRDATNRLAMYVNGAQQFVVDDTGAIAEFSRAMQAAHFGDDDLATSQLEASGGVIHAITIWNVALTADQIGELAVGL